MTSRAYSMDTAMSIFSARWRDVASATDNIEQEEGQADIVKLQSIKINDNKLEIYTEALTRSRSNVCMSNCNSMWVHIFWPFHYEASQIFPIYCQESDFYG